MSIQSWNETLITAQVDGTALANSTTATSILPAAAIFTLPPNFFGYIGKRLRIRAGGRISTVTTTPGTLTLDIRLGSVIAANGGAMTLSTTAKTNVTWRLDWDLDCRAIGASTSANLMHTGTWSSEAAASTTIAGVAQALSLPASAPAVGTGFDSTIAQTVNLFATWATASASNSITLHQFELISCN